MKQKKLKIFMLFFLLLFINLKAQAQQTIINVPSSDVLPAGDLLLKESSRFRPFSPDEYVGITPSITVGTGHGTQVSTAVATTLDGSALVRGDITAKKVWYLGDSTRLTLGGTISPYLSEQSTPDTFTYTHLSQRIKQTRTSVTAGVYYAGQRSMPNNTGAILGLEQVVLSNKLRFAIDWLSSDKSYGRIGVGLKYRPVPTVSITGALIVPNKESDKVAFNVSFSKFISLKDNNLIKKRL